jgi:hypothetical protein
MIMFGKTGRRIAEEELRNHPFGALFARHATPGLDGMNANIVIVQSKRKVGDYRTVCSRLTFPRPLQ